MKKSVASLLIAFALPVAAFARDGLVVHFKITKTSGTASSSCVNTVLMQLNESATLNFQGQYEMRLDARSLDDGMENIVFTIKDLSTSQPVYVGSAATTLKIGEAQSIDLHQLAAASARYGFFIDTSYGPLP